MVTPQRRRKTKNQEIFGMKREESKIWPPCYWKTADRTCPKEDGEEREEITPSPCMDSPLPSNNLVSIATVNQSNGHCQCQRSPAKRSSPFTEKQSHSSEEEEAPTAKRQLLLDEQDRAAVIALHGGYSKIILPSPDQPPVIGSESPSERGRSFSPGQVPQQGFSPSGSAHPPLPSLGRALSDASSGITKVVEGSGSLNSCKDFAPSAFTLLTPLHRPNSYVQQGFSPQQTAMLPPRPPLYRTVSDPTPVSVTTMEETQTKRPNRMMHRVKEMGRWFEHIRHQAEAEEHQEHFKVKENMVSQGLSPSASPQHKPVLPPRPPLHRTLSDPTPAVMEETPNSKRVKDMFKEMGKWFEHMVHEAEAKEHAEQSRPEDSIASQDGGEADNKDGEAVSVEKIGESLSIQFKCPCGKGYKVLLSGNECYYKLL